MADETAIRSEYAARREHFRNKNSDLARLANRLANLRLGLFLLMLAGGLVVILLPGIAVAGWFLLAVGLIGFGLAVVRHEAAKTELCRTSEMAIINQTALDRIDRRWSRLATVEVAKELVSLPEAIDLDLFGNASLFQLMNTTSSPGGRRALSHWLVEPAPANEILRRQTAAKELAPRLELRQQLQLQGLPLRRTSSDPDTFCNWVESEAWLPRYRWIIWCARVSPLLLVTSLLLFVLGWIPATVWLIPATFNIIVSFRWLPQVHAIFDRISLGENAFRDYANLFEVIVQGDYKCETLCELKAKCILAGKSASEQLSRLDRLLGMTNLRHSTMSHLPIQAILMWDFHAIDLLERWQSEVRKHARQWLDALAEFEALAAIASLHHDHPEWSFPQPATTAEPKLVCRDIGHPLILPGQVVTNDIEIGPPGTFVLVTGSNMSGKSTLLRSLGTNIVLAQAGAPVCAAEMSLPPLILGTSFRVRDSLADGVSFFMAELRRLKQIVDLAAACQQRGQGTMIFLMDEILQGTNSTERHLAVKRVLQHLTRQLAIGAIATHDLSLADEHELETVCTPVHFREHFSGQGQSAHMEFDYQLRSGVAPTTNALKLLEIVGLDDSSEQQS